MDTYTSPTLNQCGEICYHSIQYHFSGLNPFHICLNIVSGKYGEKNTYLEKNNNGGISSLRKVF